MVRIMGLKKKLSPLSEEKKCVYGCVIKVMMVAITTGGGEDKPR